MEFSIVAKCSEQMSCCEKSVEFSLTTILFHFFISARGTHIVRRAKCVPAAGDMRIGIPSVRGFSLTPNECIHFCRYQPNFFLEPFELSRRKRGSPPYLSNYYLDSPYYTTILYVTLLVVFLLIYYYIVHLSYRNRVIRSYREGFSLLFSSFDAFVDYIVSFKTSTNFIIRRTRVIYLNMQVLKMSEV